MSRRSRLNSGLGSTDAAYGYLAKAKTATPNVAEYALKLGGNSQVGGVDDTRVWSYSSTLLLQRDSHALSGSNNSKNLPTNVVTTGGLKIVSWPALGLMYLIAKNSVSNRFEVYSAPYVSGSTQPTWTGPLLQLSSQATLIQTAVRVTSVGLFVGEYTSGANNQGLTPPYSGANDISGGPNLWRSTNGSTFTKVLNLPPISSTVATRHIHAVYEDPYNLGHIWITVGDQHSPHYVYLSSDGGTTWNPVTAFDTTDGTNPWQTVSMGFTVDSIWFASDQVWGFGPLLLDRATGKLRWATLRTPVKNIAVPGGVPGRRITDMVLTPGSVGCASSSAAFTATDVGRFIVTSNSLMPDGTFISAVVSTTIAAGSNGATLPQSTISIGSTAGLASSGAVAISTGSGVQNVSYTGLGSGTLTGCTGGTGTLSTGGSVTQATLSQAALAASSGASAFFIGGDQFYPVAYCGAIDPATGYFYFCANDNTQGGNTAGLFCIPGPDQDIVLVKPLGDALINNTELFINNGLIWIGGYGSVPAFTQPI